VDQQTLLAWVVGEVVGLLAVVEGETSLICLGAASMVAGEDWIVVFLVLRVVWVFVLVVVVVWVWLVCMSDGSLVVCWGGSGHLVLGYFSLQAVHCWVT
jgi:hypothetical protein